MSEHDPKSWLSSHELARLLLKHRDNDVRFSIEGHRLQVDAVMYDQIDDVVVMAAAALSGDVRYAIHAIDQHRENHCPECDDPRTP